MQNNQLPDKISVWLDCTGACNMRCRHCYYAKTNYACGNMSLTTLDKFISVVAPYYKKVEIVWHGGEPLMAGYDFFIGAYELFDKYAKRYQTNFEFAIQTNGTLLDNRFIDLFNRTNTLISISYDGSFNNALRQNTEKVENVINLIKAKGVKFSCLSTISSVCVDRMVDLYDFFKKENIPFKFTPVLPDGVAVENDDVLISKEEWTRNFISLFDYWFFDLNCDVEFFSCHQILRKYLSLFYSAGNSSTHTNNHDCLNTKCLFGTIAVDPNGDLYPCGRLVEENYKLSNVFKLKDVRSAFLEDKFLELLEKNKQRIVGCKSCKWFKICNSGCYASASLGGDMTKPYEFDCYFNHKMFDHIENLLKEYDINKINKYAKATIKHYYK